MSKARDPDEYTDRTPTYIDTSHDKATSDREGVCKDCGAQVTQAGGAINSEFSGEQYGHKPDCEHSIRRRDEHSLEWRGTEEET